MSRLAPARPQDANENTGGQCGPEARARVVNNKEGQELQRPPRGPIVAKKVVETGRWLAKTIILWIHVEHSAVRCLPVLATARKSHVERNTSQQRGFQVDAELLLINLCLGDIGLLVVVPQALRRTRGRVWNLAAHGQAEG